MEQDMGKGEKHIVERLEAATNALEKTLNWLEERQGALSGEVERITATVEQSRRETRGVRRRCLPMLCCVVRRARRRCCA